MVIVELLMHSYNYYWYSGNSKATDTMVTVELLMRSYIYYWYNGNTTAIDAFL